MSIFSQMYSRHFKLQIPTSDLCSSLYICLSETFLSRWWWWCWAQLCLTLCSPMDCSLLGSSVHGIFQIRILEWVAISFSRGPSQPRYQPYISCLWHWWVYSLQLVPPIIGDWNAKVESQEVPRVTSKSGFGVQNEVGQRLTVLSKKTDWS